MKFHLGKSESASAGIARINRELCERGRQMAGNGDALTDSAVYGLRKTVKKLRAILRITRPALDNRTYRELDRLMRDIGRDLGRPRDSAVLVDTFDALLHHFTPLADEVAMQPARNALQCRFQLAQENFLEANDELSLMTRFSVIEQQVEDLDLQQFSREMLLEGIQQTYRRCRAGLQKLHDEPNTENSHDLRRQVKYTWNQLRLIRKWQAGTFNPMCTELERLDGLLGQDSDIAMLVDTVQRHPEICCNRIRAEFIIALAETRRIALLTASLHLADRLFAKSPVKFGTWLNQGTRGKHG